MTAADRDTLAPVVGTNTYDLNNATTRSRLWTVHSWGRVEIGINRYSPVRTGWKEYDPRRGGHPMTLYSFNSNSWRSSTNWAEHAGPNPGNILILTRTTPCDGCGRVATDAACRPLEYLGAFAVELRGDQSGRPSAAQLNEMRDAVKASLFGHVSRAGVPRYAR